MQEKLNTQYFIDLAKLEKNIAECKIDIDNEDEVESYLSDLDVDSGYCVGRANAKELQLPHTVRAWPIQSQ